MEAKSKKMISRIALTFLGAAALTFAQTSGTGSGTRTPPSPATLAQMRVNRLSAELNLTDAQKTTALSIFTTAYTSQQTVQTSVHTSRQSLSDAIKANNSATIDQLSATLGTLAGQMTSIEAKADAAFYAILTADQKTLYDAHPDGGFGPGGMGGAPGGPGAMMRGRRG
jgi:Spy/CpxP family protein refolding chaperone